ncbi:hypothetical protein Syun_018893 [Stephania yunnanensis]|uniref:Uncharacterized protein n=1 Tax=Stephania yunnanensis TaxID=152371 RepID=A0AAP0IVF8_9MAGN
MTKRAVSTLCYQDAQAEASYCTGKRTSWSGLGMVSSGGSNGSGVGEQWWIEYGVQRCAAAEQLRSQRSNGFRVDADDADGAKARRSAGLGRAARVRRGFKMAMQRSVPHQAAMRVTNRKRCRRTVATPRVTSSSGGTDL